jgi:GNAT superfamily N-acetyltransferase
MTFEIGAASTADVMMMAEWAAAEGWNPGLTDAQAFVVADPRGFLIGRLDGEPVTCISVVRYGEGFGFLGMYIARPDARGRGFGYRTWQAGMRQLAGRTVALDGVVAQQGNYRRSGFEPAWTNVRFEGSPPDFAAPSGVRIVDARGIPFDQLAAYDRRFFGAPRDAFLAAWISLPARSAHVALRDGEVVGFAVLRDAHAASRIGPLFAADREIASALVGSLAHERGAATVAVDVPGVNGPALAWAEAADWRPSFETARMYTGAAPEIDVRGLFGITSLELG